MVMASLGAAAGWAVNSLTNFDSAGAAANFYVTSEGNKAAQAFDRRMARINYKIQRQQLHREDIRDLVQLTVGRMDIYHVVGTLLLTFCIQWYTDNTMLTQNPPLPQWFVTLFFVSNFTAVGYLIFSVWLAMHASVASHSIGVRLLTSFARLSIPSASELSKIRFDIMPFIDSLNARFAHFIGRKKADNSSKEETVQKETEDIRSTMAELHARSVPLSCTPAAPRSASYVVEEPMLHDAGLTHPILEEIEKEEEEEDDREHFRRFLQEQKRWLCYDAFSRICMSFGMNQMLQALSYYILGVVWADSPATAVTSFVAVKLLAGFLLQLDVSETDGGRLCGLVAYSFLYMIPPIVACLLLWLPRATAVSEDSRILSFLAFPVFAMHGGWLIFLAFQVRTKDGPSKDSVAAYLPRKLRTVFYLNVIDPDQRKLAEQAKIDMVGQLASKSSSHLKVAREELESKMQQVEVVERERGTLSISDRNSPELRQLSTRLEELVFKSRDTLSSRESRSSPELQYAQSILNDELRSAERQLNHFAVWSKTPEIHSQLEALRDPDVQANLGDAEKQEIEDWYQDFLQRCTQLKLGDALPTTHDEKVAVRIEAYPCGLPQSIWIDTKYGNEFRVEEPKTFLTPEGVRLRRSVSPQEFLQKRVQQFQQLQQPLLPQSPTEAERSEASQWAPEAIVEESKLTPVWATPDDKLPGNLVRRFTMGTALLWWLAGFSHIFRHTCKDLECFFKAHNSTDADQILWQLDVTWPEPAGFFDVASMHCNSSQVLIGGEFTMYTANRLSGAQNEIGNFTELGQGTFVAGSTVLCDSEACSVLVPSESGSWWLQPLEDAGNVENATRVPVPPSWRIVAALRLQQQCNEACSASSFVPWARLAGWDGSSIIVADLLQGKDAVGMPTYTVRQRFRVAPGRAGSSTAGLPFASPLSKARCSKRYGSVSALQLRGSEAEQLMVLSDGRVLDFWDLPSSTLVGRWRIGKDEDTFTAMCMDDRQLLLSSNTSFGPLLKAWQLPPAILKSE